MRPAGGAAAPSTVARVAVGTHSSTERPNPTRNSFIPRLAAVTALPRTRTAAALIAARYVSPDAPAGPVGPGGPVCPRSVSRAVLDRSRTPSDRSLTSLDRTALDRTSVE